MLRRRILVLLVLCMAMLYGSAQEIKIEHTRLGRKYYVNDSLLYRGDLHTLLRTDPEAAKRLRSVSFMTGIASGLGFVSGGLVGYELGTKLGGGRDIKGERLLLSAGLFVVGVIFDVNANRELLRVVQLYNSNYRKAHESNSGTEDIPPTIPSKE